MPFHKERVRVIDAHWVYTSSVTRDVEVDDGVDELPFVEGQHDWIADDMYFDWYRDINESRQYNNKTLILRGQSRKGGDMAYWGVRAWEASHDMLQRICSSQLMGIYVRIDDFKNGKLGSRSKPRLGLRHCIQGEREPVLYVGRGVWRPCNPEGATF